MWKRMFTRSPSHIRIASRRIVGRDAQAARVSDRQELIAGFDQQALEQATVILIGAGGIGSEIGEGLARKGIGHLRIFDHDFVELSNLNRQHFFAADIGKRKGPQLARNLAVHATCGTVLEGYGLSFQDALASGMDMRGSLVVCGVDNGETRVAVSTHYWKLKIPVIFIAVDLMAEAGYVFIQQSGQACFGCLFPKTMYGRKAPCRAPAAKDILKSVGGIALYAIDSLLMDRKRNWNHRLIHLAGFAEDHMAIIERRQDCPLCDGKNESSICHEPEHAIS